MSTDDATSQLPSQPVPATDTAPGAGDAVPDTATDTETVSVGSTRPLDLAGLAAHAARTPDLLSDAWSQALDATALQRGLDQYEARLSALAVALKAHYAAENEASVAAGQEPIGLAGWPIQDADLVRLVTLAGVAERRANAEVLVVAAALEAAAGLRAPGKVVWTLPAGTQETFWESGGFARLAAQLRVVTTLQAQGQHDSSDGWLRLLECAGVAQRAGLPEATLLYLRLALPGVHAALANAARGEQSAGTLHEQPPTPTGLAGEGAPTEDGLPLVDDALIGVRVAVAELIGVVEGYARADAGDLGTAVLLGDGLLQRLGLLVHARLFALSPDG